MTALRRLLAIRSGEGRLVGLLAGLFAAIEMGRGLGEVAADTLFISRYGAEFLPWLYVVLGLVSLVVALVYGAAVGRLPRGPFLVGLLVAFALGLVAVRVALASGRPEILPVAWITVFVVGAILTTLVWTVAATTLDARQAKRLFPICTSAAIAGGFVGTLSAGPLARSIGTENLILLFAALLAVAAVLLRGIAPAFVRRPAAPGVPVPLRDELRAGFDHVRRSPLMRLVAVAYVLFAILLFSVTFPFLQALGQAFPDEADLATALGLLAAAVTGVSFVVSIAFANRFYVRFGVVAGALLLPLVYVGGFAVWLVQFNLATAVALRFGQQVTQRGISNAAWSALYAVVPAERRPQVLAFIDGVPGQLGTSLSGVLLIVVGTVFASSGDAVPAPVFAMGLLAALACTWVVILIRRRYGDALVSALRAGLGEQVLEGGPGLAVLAGQPDVVRQLEAGLASDSTGARQLAVEMLCRIGGPAVRERLQPALADSAPEVRAAAFDGLAVCGASVDPDLLAAGLRDGDAEVRAAAVRWGATDPARLDGHLARLASDRAVPVRVEAAVAMARLGRSDEARVIVAALLESSAPDARAAGLRVAAEVGVDAARLLSALEDPAPAVRRAAAAALGGMPEEAPAVLEVLETGSRAAQAAALDALAGSRDPAVHDRVRDWALREVERAIVLRRARAGLASPDGEAMAFLEAVLGHRERRREALLLGALAALGAAGAIGAIRRCLRSPDADVRAQAIEAVESLGDRRLGRAIVSLLDADVATSPERTGVLRGLVDDPDPWIRALALRALAEQSPAARERIVARAAADTDPLVRGAVADVEAGGPWDVARTGRTLGDMERMLFLRRVPLFGELAPEDLQRIAAAADERLYPAGEPLVEEGGLGDELIVIVEGSVEVVRGAGDDRRVLRTYGTGDHVGELAVLREAPRAATVVAVGADVRGLVIGGEGLRAILRERPEAAMAMLATLAERLSRY